MFLIQNYIINRNELLSIANNSLSEIHHLVIDSRGIMYPFSSLFFAIKGNVRDGHDFIDNAYQQGVRNFVINDSKFLEKYKDVNFILAHDVINVLQKIATDHRLKFPNLEVIGVTGSNGKTIVKEWLSIMFSKSKRVVKTPKSFNSQIGVPLSVWQINENHELGIFEAGISTRNEMAMLEKIIQPSIGIFTNIGQAHESGFDSIQEKIKEKVLLFEHCKSLIFCGDSEIIYKEITAFKRRSNQDLNIISWGFNDYNNIKIISQNRVGQDYILVLSYKEKKHTFSTSFLNEYFFENLMHCITTCLHLGLTDESIEDSIPFLSNLEMRLQITEGMQNSLLINDAYTNDREALNIAIPFLIKHAGKRRKIIILSELDNSSLEQNAIILSELVSKNIDQLVLIGKSWNDISLPSLVMHFNTTSELINELDSIVFENTIVLIKGSRKYNFENIFSILSKQSHSVNLDIDLNALENNVSTFASLLKSNTQIIAIIKASAYGSGSEEVAKLLQNKGIAALGVAFADEGVQLRKGGITLPIIVLNADANSFNAIHEYNLEMEVYSIAHLKSILEWNNGAFISKARIHLKLDTGMSRLGFQKDNLIQLIQLLVENPIRVDTIFSHLSSSEDTNDDDFSHDQANRFKEYYSLICEKINYRPKRHLLNSSGIIRFPEYHFDYVRLGLGLYGIDSTDVIKNRLEKVHSLHAKIIQIKYLQPGDFVGYNRKHKVTQPMKIGILNIGYADGLLRKSGNSRYSVFINGNLASIVGNVCMDLTIIDITHIPNINENDSVEIFGKANPIENLAEVCDTIPYEILCRIAPRIIRNYTS